MVVDGCTAGGLEALLKSRALAGAVAQEVQAGAAHFVVPFHHHFGDARRIGQEGAFHADAVAGNAADGKAGIVAAPAGEEHNALEFLDAFAVAFFDLVMHADRVPGEEVGDIRIFFCFDRG